MDIGYDFETEYRKLYLDCIAQRREYLNKLQNLIDKIKNVQSKGSVRKKEIENIKKAICDIGKNLNTINRFLKFLRIGNQEDADYRMDIYSNFHKAVQEKINNDIPLRFHGTPIYFAREIIRSGSISSSQDRLGYKTSEDLCGHFSVSNIVNLQVTIKCYTHLTDFSMPAGCVFVLLPGIFNRRLLFGNQMKSVNFRKKPWELVAIMTTPENVERVKSWCVESGVDPEKVCEFYEFIRRFENEKELQIKPR